MREQVIEPCRYIERTVVALIREQLGQVVRIEPAQELTDGQARR